MTIQEFHRNFDIELDKTLDFEYPYIQPEQKDYWLNKAVDRLIYNIIEPKDPNAKGFEETQERIEDIRTLVKESETLDIVKSGSKYNVSLPDDYMYKLRVSCITNTTDCGTKNVGADLVKQVYLNNMLKDPFWKPSYEEPLYIIINDKLQFETLDEFTINEVSMVYLKKPAYMKLGSQYIVPEDDVECDLPEWSHLTILSIAISMMLENIESQRYQTNLNELNKIT